MRSVRTVALGISWLVLIATAGRADALTAITVDDCLAGQVRAVAKAATGYATCHAKAAAKGIATDTQCLGKVTLTFSSLLGRLESRRTCLVEGAAVELADDAFDSAAALDATVGHAPKKCDAAKMRLAGKYVSAIAGCYAKAARGTGVIDVACVGKAVTKLGSGIAKAETGADCSHVGQDLALRTAASDFVDSTTCELAPSSSGCPQPTPTPMPTTTPIYESCWNGVNDPFEDCDPSAPSSGWALCPPDGTCFACSCACPSTMEFVPDASAPESVLDVGWQGLGHRTPFAAGGALTLQLDCNALSRPCGTCALHGPVANADAGAGQIQNRRCSTDTSKVCSSNATCAARTCLGGLDDGASCATDGDCPSGTCPPAGYCDFYLGPTLPFASGGLPVCTTTSFDGPISGTANVESGEARLLSFVTTETYAGLGIDRPCPRCVGDGAPNDGTRGGACDGGARAGLACDASGAIAGRPDFGSQSLDCPPEPALRIAKLRSELVAATDTVAMTLKPASPFCSAWPSEKCLCDTCNNPYAEPCTTNADCPASGGSPGVCGGRRCLDGANAGAPCTASSACPGSTCGRPGGATKPFGCVDDCEPSLDTDCADADGDGEGTCVHGPTDDVCTLASGHGQRGCQSDGDCGGAPGSCAAEPRPCFPTGGGTFQSTWYKGTDTLVAFGMEDPPVAGIGHPTLGAVFCLPPTGSSAVDAVFGLPGPGRLTVKGTLRERP